jgi:tRNA dimethylallyltransferase
MKKKLICIVGPTASGKTDLSLKLAQYFKTEIISADSRQFYKEMQIGTAAPTPEELKLAPHHFIHHISIKDEYTVGDYEKDFLERSTELFKNHEYLILVGGSGLYIDAAVKGLDNLPGKNQQIRESLEKLMHEEGIKALQVKLQALDPEFYKEIDHQNPHRLIRAIEILQQVPGKSMRELRQVNNRSPRDFETIYIGLNTDRQLLYDRINKRVDLMMDQGLLNEAKSLFPFRHLNALNTVGYKELFAYMEGKHSLDEAISEIKKNTRRFAKRQLTWFRKNKEIRWMNIPPDLSDVLSVIKN